MPRSAKPSPEPATRSLTVLETSTSLAAALRRHAGADVDGDAADVVADQLALARVEAGADLEPERADGVADRAGAADRAGRPVEGREEAVARGLRLSRPLNRASSRRTTAWWRCEQLAPALVAELAASARSSRRCR